ncbi:MAG: putative RNA-binding Zn-ribbon protein involved in translation (DUF1610 family) [Candidatus Azotimanducaceae bacterium]|jgi:predicted RNA-binding Zn-ribbon protein involved in translation (DUF1610 family)
MIAMNLGLIFYRVGESDSNAVRRRHIAAAKIFAPRNRTEIPTWSISPDEVPDEAIERIERLSLIESSDSGKYLERLSSASAIQTNCSSCSKAIFHTEVFEAKWLHQCPIHGRMLRTHCSTCGKKYRFSKADCPECGFEIDIETLAQNSAFDMDLYKIDVLQRLDEYARSYDQCAEVSFYTGVRYAPHGVQPLKSLDRHFPSVFTKINPDSAAAFDDVYVPHSHPIATRRYTNLEKLDPETMNALSGAKTGWVAEAVSDATEYLYGYLQKWEANYVPISFSDETRIFGEALDTWKRFMLPGQSGFPREYFWIETTGWPKPSSPVPILAVCNKLASFRIPEELGRDIYYQLLLATFRYILEHYLMFHRINSAVPAATFLDALASSSEPQLFLPTTVQAAIRFVHVKCSNDCLDLIYPEGELSSATPEFVDFTSTTVLVALAQKDASAIRNAREQIDRAICKGRFHSNLMS